MATKATKGATKGTKGTKGNGKDTPKESKVARLERQLREAQEAEANAKAAAEAKAKAKEPTPEPTDARVQQVSLQGTELARVSVGLSDLTENAEVVKLLPITDETLAQVKDALQGEGQHYPIIIGTDNVIIDGHTRARAAVALGWSEIFAHKVGVAGASPEGLELALSLNANKRHLTMQQKRGLMQNLLLAHPNWSNGRIARVSGMSAEAVRLRRNEYIEAGKISADVVVEDAKGRKINTSNIGESAGSGEGKTPKFPAVLLSQPRDRYDMPEELTEAQVNALLTWHEAIGAILTEVAED